MKDTNISVFKSLLKAKDVPYIIPLYKSLERIRVGKSKDLIDRIRNEKDKEKRNELKRGLYCILFAGEFKERNKNGLIHHSGLMVVDFDGYPTAKEMNDHLEMLKTNNHFVTLFISPSGNGIKGVVKIPVSDKIEHEKYFKQFYKDFEYNYFDKSNCNVDRVCYESYDPNIYINYDAELYKPELIDEGFSVQERVPLIPINDEDVIISKIMNFNWKKDFVEGERNAFIFDLAGAFCEYGVSQTMAEGYILNNVVIGSFSETEAKTTIKSAYKCRQFGSKYFENYAKIDKIKLDLKKNKKEVLNIHKIDEDVYNEIKEVADVDDFWFINDKGKVQILPISYKLFLERNGFKKHFPNDVEKPQFVFVNSNKVEITSVLKIKDFVLNYLMERKELEVWNYCASFQNLFAENYLSMLESIDLMMLSDTRTKSFISFNNGILQVTKDSAELVDYIDVDGYVWTSSIINRDYKEFENKENDYSKFIFNISNEDPYPLECVIGYLISTYKNRSNNKAVILNDEVITDNPEGGTGKGLFVQGISQIRKTSIIDGKQFDSKKSFAYQTVSLDTKVLVFDDVKKNFDFEEKFSLVTEGLTLERKNKDAIKLNVHDSPKLLLSTNYAIKGEGNSHDRRRHEIEIAQYYGSKLNPADDFGRELFDDWEIEDFQRFDNYMVMCLQSYLKDGLIQQNSKNTKLRKFIAGSSMEFYDWIIDTENFALNTRQDTKEKFEQFTNDYQDFKKWLTQKRFNMWVQNYSRFINAEFKKGNSNGQRWFLIQTEEEIEEDINEDEIIF